MVSAGQITHLHLTLDVAPSGLSGFDIDISLSNSAVAEITNVQYHPDLRPTSVPSNLPDSQVNLFAADIDELIDAGAINIPLATIELRTSSQAQPGVTTSIDINLNTPLGIDDDFGDEITLQVTHGTLKVN